MKDKVKFYLLACEYCGMTVEYLLCQPIIKLLCTVFTNTRKCADRTLVICILWDGNLVQR